MSQVYAPSSQTWHSSRILSQRLVPPIHPVLQDGKHGIILIRHVSRLLPYHVNSSFKYLWILSLLITLPCSSVSYPVSLACIAADSSLTGLLTSTFELCTFLLHTIVWGMLKIIISSVMILFSITVHLLSTSNGRVRNSENLLCHKSNENTGKNCQNQLFHNFEN